MTPEVSVQTFNWREWASFAPTWERIHNMCPVASIFLSREWVDCWLTTFGEELKPELLAFLSEDEVVGCCFLVWRTDWSLAIPLRRVYLNCAGENDADSTCIEFNSLLSLPEYEENVAKALVTLLRARKWDELLLPGVVDQDAIRILMSCLGNNEIREVPSYYVDFMSFRRPPADYLNSLSPHTRYQIRRTQRAFQEIGGNCTLCIAQNPTEALEMLQELARLHQLRWEGRGHDGAFSSRKFTGFHEMMIRRDFGRTLLFRVQAGTEVVGVLYCFLFREWVYFYQSGLSYALDRRRSPGLLTLSLSISRCLERPDFKGFDLMAGDKPYKRSLAATSRPLRWIVVRRPTVRNRLLSGLRSLKHAYADVTKKASDSKPPPNPTGREEDEPLAHHEGGESQE